MNVIGPVGWQTMCSWPSLSRTLAIAELVENLKTASSKWLKAQASELAAFGW
ncbi:MAG TPA: hypothetical protein VNT26_07035 [Candidatus Sulfotelmatobacter sp.]|nr:hypothetical protein [Candidatus Sulfotelmatobacter sp.]HWI58807.1 hypothetical protein [Bacillota bacterium]